MANFSGIIEDKLKKVFSPEQAGVLAGVLSDVKALVERDLVKASDFNELKEIVKELAGAQKRTEEKVGVLAEAQRRTEEKVEALAEAQRRTEEKVGILVEAQQRTEEEIRKLVIGLNNMRSDLGGLQRSFGYMLENEAYRFLPSIMKEKFGIEVKERFLRKYFKLSDGMELEINVIGKGVKEGEDITIVGEAKSILEGREVDHFLEVLERLKNVIGERVFKIFITHSARPSVEQYAMNNQFQVIYTYEF